MADYLRSHAKYVPHLRQNGPATADELGGHPNGAHLAQWNVKKMLVTSSAPAGQNRGRQTPVFYIEGQHDLKDVVRKYLDANPGMLENRHKGAISRLFGRHSKAMQRAWKAVADEYDVRVAGGSNKGGATPKTCPFCGKKDIAYLPTHLPKCTEAS